MQIAPTSTPLPSTPTAPPELRELVQQPLANVTYDGSEERHWRDGVPVLGPAFSSQRSVQFDELSTGAYDRDRTGKHPVYTAPVFASHSFDDAVLAATSLNADPLVAHNSYALLRANDGSYFITGFWGLSGRGPAHATSAWSAPARERHGLSGHRPADADPVAFNWVSHRHIDHVARFTGRLDAIITPNDMIDLRNAPVVAS